MLGCIDCTNAIFHEQLGEYKCSIYKKYTKCEEQLRCEHWVEGTPGKSKEDVTKEEA